MRRRRPRLIAALTAAAVVFSIQQAFVVPAIPAFRRELHTTPTWSAWLLTIFLLSASVSTPLLGKLGDEFGRRRVLLITLGILFVGSVGCACAWGIASLIVFRGIQGVGGAVFPLSFAIMREQLPPGRLGLGIGIVSSAFGVGGVVGIAAAGPIIDHLSWRVLFIVGAAVALLAMFLVRRAVAATPPPATRTQLDLRGALLFSAGLLCFLLGLTESERWGWSSPAVVGLLVATPALLLVWWWCELRAQDPMVDVRVLARREVVFANLAAVLLGISVFAVGILVPSLVQTPSGLPGEPAGFGLGASVTSAGLFLLPSSITMVIFAPLAGMLRRHGALRAALAVAMALTGVAAASIALWHDAAWQVFAAMAVYGAGNGIALAVLPKLIIDAVAPEQTAVATGVNTVLRLGSGVLGAQLVATVLSVHLVGDTAYSTEAGYELALWLTAAVGFAGIAAAALTGARVRRPSPAYATRS